MYYNERNDNFAWSNRPIADHKYSIMIIFNANESLLCWYVCLFIFNPRIKFYFCNDARFTESLPVVHTGKGIRTHAYNTNTCMCNKHRFNNAYVARIMMIILMIWHTSDLYVLNERFSHSPESVLFCRIKNFVHTLRCNKIVRRENWFSLKINLAANAITVRKTIILCKN